MYNIDSLTDMSELRFARGFLLTRGTPNVVPISWERLTIGAWELAYDPRTSVSFTGDSANTTLLIGHACGAFETQTMTELLALLHDTPPDSRQSQQDELVGRYVVIRLGTNGSSLQQDAAGMRSVFFAKNEDVISSHPLLVAQQIGVEPSEYSTQYLKANGLTCMPGRVTQYRNVFTLTPNTVLNLTTRETSRVYYGTLEKEISASNAVGLLKDAVKPQLSWLAKRSPIVSLSAGLDSRTSLALLRPISESVASFTYDLGLGVANKHAVHDVEIAQKLASISQVPFETIVLDGPPVDKTLNLVLSENYHKPHSRKLSLKYIDHLKNRLNVRSNIYGIARNTYASRNIHITDGSGMCRLAYGSKNQDALAIRAFDEFIEETSFPLRADVSAEDMFLWEHRIGVWQTAIYMEADLSHESHVLINQRNLLKSLLSVPEPERTSGKVQKDLIRSAWPELAALEVNGTPF